MFVSVSDLPERKERGFPAQVLCVRSHPAWAASGWGWQSLQTLQLSGELGFRKRHVSGFRDSHNLNVQ